MKYIKTFESHSIKTELITKDELDRIIPNYNLVTLPYFQDESSLLNHIDNNFDTNDAALIMNPPKKLTSIESDGKTAILYTKNKTYLIEDVMDI